MGDTEYEAKNAKPTLDLKARGADQDAPLPKVPRAMQGMQPGSKVGDDSKAGAEVGSPQFDTAPKASNKHSNDGDRSSAPAPKSPSLLTDMGIGSKSADASEEHTLNKVHTEDQALLMFGKYFDALRDGLAIAMRAIDDPDIDSDTDMLGTLLEIAIDAVIAGSAEGLAGLAIKGIVEHVVAKVGESVADGVKEAVKATFEGSAKAVRGKTEGKPNEKDLKNEYFRLSTARIGDFKSAVAQNWPAIATVMDSLPASAVQAVAGALASVPTVRLNDVTELHFITSWVNFLARTKHGVGGMVKDKNGDVHGGENIDPSGIELHRFDGSFQRPEELHGVLEVTVSHHGYRVNLDRVGKPVRDELRRLGGPGSSLGLKLGDLHMNMLVRDGQWGGMATNEMIVGADGTILNMGKPPSWALEIVERAKNLPVSFIAMDDFDRDGTK